MNQQGRKEPKGSGQLLSLQSFIPPFHPVLLIPLLMGLVVVLILAVWPASVSWPDGAWFVYLPDFFLLAAAIAGVCFNQTRVLFLAVAVFAALFSVDQSYFEAYEPARGVAALLLGSLFLPLLAAVFHWLQERGLFTPYGLSRTMIVLFFVGLVILLPLSYGFQQAVMSSSPPSFRTAPGVLRIPGLSLLVLMGSLPFLLFRQRGESPCLGALTGMALGFVFLALNFNSSLFPLPHQRPALILFGSLGGFTLLLVVMETAWRQMNIDELTELPGRRALKHRMRCLGKDYLLAVVDIDHFKHVNDTYGHLAGDQILRYVASELRQNLSGAAYRFGGEEFVIVYERHSYKEAMNNLDDLREAISRKDFFLRGGTRPAVKPKQPQRKADAPFIRLTVSIGAAGPSEHFQTPQEVLDAADQALYKAKENGRNRVYHNA